MPDSPLHVRIYDRVVLSRPRRFLLVLLAIFAFFGYQIRHFRLDASADTLILEQDKDLRHFYEIIGRYGTNEFLFLVYTPSGGRDLLADETVDTIARLRDELAQLERVESVLTIVDIPLLRNPPVPLRDLRDNTKTLQSPDVDKELARNELVNSPLYRDLIVSPDMSATAIQVNFRRDETFQQLLRRRIELKDKELNGPLAPADARELEKVSEEYFAYQDKMRADRHEDIKAVRRIMGRYRDDAELFLGGVPMIADDMITFIKNDLKVFGFGMMLFLTVTLGAIFRRKRWVVLPMLCCILSAVVMAGLVGFFGWDVTVISSNFVSLQLVLTMAIAIHLIVRYNELLEQTPEADHRTLVLRTVQSKLEPCIYTTLTTIAGFTSLLFCDILPVINFGLMMTVGLCVSIVVTFLLFPAALMLMSKPTGPAKRQFGEPITRFFARFTERRPGAIYVVTIATVVITIAGIAKLEVENSFIDYFRKSTEIYQGMAMIDEKLGGTAPLDVTIDFADMSVTEESAKSEGGDDRAADNDVFAEFAEFDKSADAQKYWFTPHRLEAIGRIHEYLEALPASGKVLSLHTLMRIARELNEGRELDSFDLALLFRQLSDDFKEVILDPYVSVEDNQARLNVRVRDSMPTLRRDPWLKQIQADLDGKLTRETETARVAGLMVLYNNVLQSLFRSQVKTIQYTVLLLMVMFVILFRSLRISLIAVFPNILSSLVILGVMGLLNIPLDLMTITIVAISVGIAVDNTIHYIHRFKEEFAHDHHYRETMLRCHATIGNAMYYTSITIIVGFSILALSNFIPSMLFGLLTGLAMVIALVAALTLLPLLIMLLKPFGPEGGESSVEPKRVT